MIEVHSIRITKNAIGVYSWLFEVRLLDPSKGLSADGWPKWYKKFTLTTYDLKIGIEELGDKITEVLCG